MQFCITVLKEISKFWKLSCKTWLIGTLPVKKKVVNCVSQRHWFFFSPLEENTIAGCHDGYRSIKICELVTTREIKRWWKGCLQFLSVWAASVFPWDFGLFLHVKENLWTPVVEMVNEAPWTGRNTIAVSAPFATLGLLRQRTP